MGIFAKILKDRTSRKMFGRSLQKEKDTYEAIKEETDLAPVSKKMGTRSIMFSMLTVLTVALTILGYYLLFQMLPSAVFLSIFLGIALGVVAIVLVVLFFVKAVYCLVLQFKLNKTKHTWIAFSLIILPALLFILAILIIIGFANGAK